VAEVERDRLPGIGACPQLFEHRWCEVQPGGGASYTIIVSNNAGPVPPVTFTLTGGPLNGSMRITPLGNNVFLLSVSTDPLDNESIASVLITATGPNGTQQIEVSLEIDQIP
jgi:hypothetical protein